MIIGTIVANDDPNQLLGPRPSRRYSDKPIVRFWRDIVPLLAVGLAFWAVVLNGNKADRAEIRAFDARARIVETEARNVKRIASVEAKDRDTARSTAYRLCSRDDVIRAVLHWATLRNPGQRKLLRLLQAREGLPILVCDTNLRGKPARVMSRKMQEDYVRRWVNGFLNRPGPKLARAEIGICRQRIGVKLKPKDC